MCPQPCDLMWNLGQNHMNSCGICDDDDNDDDGDDDDDDDHDDDKGDVRVVGVILVLSWRSWGPFWLQVGRSWVHFGSKSESLSSK